MHKINKNSENIQDHETWLQNNENIDLNKIKENIYDINDFLKYKEKLAENYPEKKVNTILAEDSLLTKNGRRFIRKGFQLQYIRNVLLKIFDVKITADGFEDLCKSVLKGFDPENLQDYVPYWTYKDTFDESLPYHYLNETGKLRVKVIMWLMSRVYPIIEYSPMIIKIISMCLVFLNFEETYYLMVKFIQINYNYQNEQLYKIRWHVRFNNFEINKLKGSILQSLCNISDTIHCIYMHLYSINFPAEKLFEEMSLNLFVGFLSFHGVCRLFVFYMKEGVKALYRITYALLKTIKDDILLIKNANEVIKTVKEKSQQIKDLDSLFDLAFSLSLNRKNNRYSEQIFIRKDSTNPASIYILPEVDIQSSILSQKQFIHFWSLLPEEFKIRNAKLIYNTQSEGYCINSIYQLRSKYCAQNFIIFFIITSTNDIFGGGLSCLIELTDNKYIKPSNSFVFSITPAIKIYTLVKDDVENVFFANLDCFMLGGGKNGPAIYLDKDLKHGYSTGENCFNSPSFIKDNKYGEYVLKKMEIYLLN
jgi:hypothetical protein